MLPIGNESDRRVLGSEALLDIALSFNSRSPNERQIHSMAASPRFQ
jgi:hypothetical protein